ncbi:MAG: type II secretion system F family protein [Actinomycetota bacterium]|nr:type II secretion system F family protein [Actinomycetota bacterium]
MFNLTIGVLVMFAVLLAWPSESIHRLHQLSLPRDSSSSAPLVQALQSRFSQSRQRAAQSHRVIDALASLEAELQSGQAPAVALSRSAGVPPAWPTALAALRIGGDVATALHIDAEVQPVLGHLAACWEVAAHTGSGLSQAVAMLAESARTREELEATLNAELASPRATMRVLSLLPVVGIFMGISLGADPMGWLLGNPIGLMCATGGLLLTASGWLWSRQLVRAVERQL